MREIKISELSIGDWVMFTPNKKIYVAEPRFTSAPAKITGTYCGGEVILEIECHREFMAIPLSCIKPIPLTPEILEKNGFENIDNKYPFPTFRCDDKENYLCITIGFPEGDKTKRKRTFIEIDGIHIYIGHLIINFVHELQHTLKLCGIDKEIIV
jgi:hypothetical protein